MEIRGISNGRCMFFFLAQSGNLIKGFPLWSFGLSDTKPALRRADIRPPEESSGWIFRDVRMEPVLVSLFIGRKGTHTADWAVRALSLAGSILKSRKIHPEDSSGGRISALRRAVLYPGLEDDLKMVLQKVWRWYLWRFKIVSKRVWRRFDYRLKGDLEDMALKMVWTCNEAVSKMVLR